LSDKVIVEVAREQQLYRQKFSRGHPASKLEKLGPVKNKRGTSVSFHPDPEIFGKARWDPERLFRMSRAKAYLFAGVEIRWHCAEELVRGAEIPAEDTFKFPGGLSDFLSTRV